MILSVLLSLIIIGLWTYSAVLSFSFYSTGKFNRFFFKNIYVISILNIFQAVLGIYFIVTGDDHLQKARWIAFSLMQINFLYFVMRAYKNRHLELFIMAIFNILVLLNTVYYSVIFYCVISLILVILSYCSGVKILKKNFTWIFATYGLTSIIPSIFGFTTVESLMIGVVFSLSFMFGVVKLYKKEKVDVELKEKIASGEIG